MEVPVIVDIVRTAGGRRNGQLSGWHPVELAAATLNGLLEQSSIDPSLVDDVFFGCVTQVGAQSMNVARSAVLSAGWPESVPATTIDRQCGSSQQALHFAAQSVMAGVNDVVVAGGIECMSTVPMFSSTTQNLADPYGPVLQERYEDRVSFGVHGLVSQGIAAELVAKNWHLTREDLDSFGLRSQQLAARARDDGRFDKEIFVVPAKRRNVDDGSVIEDIGLASSDEGIRSTSIEKLADLKPAFIPDGLVTAGNSSQITDGASATLVMSEKRAIALGLRPRAILSHFSVVGVDPVSMLTGPIAATRKLLERSKLEIDDIDLFEVNEAFAPVVLAWLSELNVNIDRVNVNGGAIALGHPLGASGTKLMATLVNELERRNGKYGILAVCEGGGMANATLVERYQ
jgi:acetyl-CoA acyltransferase